MRILTGALTFGANFDLEDAVQKHEHERIAVQNAAEQLSAARTCCLLHLEKLVQAKKRGLRALKRARGITKRWREVQTARSTGQSLVPTARIDPLQQIDATINGFDAALRAAQGAGIGTSVGLGAWAMVSAFGTASTGAAISGLSGAAATHATLAWFGGGALAAGGAGMLGGALVLGAVVAVPAVLLAGFQLRSELRKQTEAVKQQIAQMQTARVNLEKCTTAFHQAPERADFVAQVVEECTVAFLSDYRCLFPWFFLSHVRRILRWLWTRQFFLPEEMHMVQRASTSGAALASALNLQVFDQHGNCIVERRLR